MHNSIVQAHGAFHSFVCYEQTSWAYELLQRFIMMRRLSRWASQTVSSSPTMWPGLPCVMWLTTGTNGPMLGGPVLNAACSFLHHIPLHSKRQCRGLHWPGPVQGRTQPCQNGCLPTPASQHQSIGVNSSAGLLPALLQPSIDLLRKLHASLAGTARNIGCLLAALLPWQHCYLITQPAVCVIM